MRDPFDDTSTRARASTTRSEVQFTDVVGVMWRRRWLVALMVLVSVGLSAAFAFSQPKADGCSPADEGSWPRNSGDQTSAEPPFRVAMARSATPRSEPPTR